MYLTETTSTTLAQPVEENHRFRRLLKLTPSFELLGREHAARETAESCVSDKFHSAFGAELESFLPYMLTMHCAGRLTGVSGINPASHGTLFLEQYLTDSLETHLEKAVGHPVDRNSVVEIGNLVSATNGGSLAVFIVLASALAACGCDHMVFTATRKLRSRFARLGFEFQHVADANPHCLPDSSAESWGSYYDNDPQVVVGSSAQAVELIKSRALFSCLAKTLSGEIDRVSAQLLQTREAA